MRKSLNDCKETFVNYIARTAKNKLCALILIIIGLLALVTIDDGTPTAVCLLMGIALFFAKDNIFKRY